MHVNIYVFMDVGNFFFFTNFDNFAGRSKGFIVFLHAHTNYYTYIYVYIHIYKEHSERISTKVCLVVYKQLKV